MTEPKPAVPTCACRALAAYDCWRFRYERRCDDMDEPWDADRVEADGGPCECACHVRDDEDWA